MYSDTFFSFLALYSAFSNNTEKKKKLCVAVWLFGCYLLQLATPTLSFLSTHITYSSLSVIMASSTNDCPEPSDSLNVSVPIIACLTVHVSGQGVKKKSMKKEIKIKEFDHSFSATKLNYLNFLAAFLKSTMSTSFKLQIVGITH